MSPESRAVIRQEADIDGKNGRKKLTLRICNVPRYNEAHTGIMLPNAQLRTPTNTKVGLNLEEWVLSSRWQLSHNGIRIDRY